MAEQFQDVTRLNDRSLNTLIRAITLSQGQFALILVRCNYSQLRDRLLQQLRDRCPVPFEEITLSESAKNLYTTLHCQLNQRQAAQNPEQADASALMVLGLEAVTAIDSLLTATNLVREELRKQFAFPVVLWVNDRILQKLARLAPDLNSWASTAVIQFELATPELVQALRTHTNRLFSAILDMGDERFLPNSALLPSHYLGTMGTLLRQSELEFALNDLHERQFELEPDLQANLDFLLGQEAHAGAELETARECYERSLAYWSQAAARETQTALIPHPSALERQACILIYLGLWWRSYAVLQRTVYENACRQARDCFQRSLDSLEQANRQDLIARFIIPLAEVLQKLGQWEALERVAQNALVLHNLYVNQVRQARDRGFLAEVALSKQNWTEAKQQVEIALRILADLERSLTEAEDPIDPQLEMSYEIARRYHTGWYLLLLARAEENLGQMEQAIAHLEAARNQAFPQDDPQLHIQILQALQTTYFRKGHYLEAFHTKQTQRSIEHQYGFRAFVGALRLEPQRHLLPTVTDFEDEKRLLAQEIRASGRQQDVDRLVYRLGRPDAKLTVIHGPSGVGKSSIVNAGLIPALSDRVVGEGQIMLPLLVDRYTDWQTALEKKLQPVLARPETDTVDAAPSRSLDLLRAAINQRFFPVLIFDQFEEFFFVYETLQQRRPFYEFLRDCLYLEFVKVVLVLREDYLHYLLEFQRLAKRDKLELDSIQDILGKDVRYSLGDFSAEDAKTVIEQLTQQAGFYLEPDLVEKLVCDLACETGEIRPIELQVVGAQLQADNITTLAQYRQKGPKERLVQRSLECVVQDCGPENEALARIVLFLLTNENGTRPLKTRDDLEADLVDLGLTSEIKKLDLVLEVLVGSGLLFLIPETPADCYQLVHDYLVSFIRKHIYSRFRDELFERFETLENRINAIESDTNRRVERLKDLRNRIDDYSEVGEELTEENRRLVRSKHYYRLVSVLLAVSLALLLLKR